MKSTDYFKHAYAVAIVALLYSVLFVSTTFAAGPKWLDGVPTYHYHNNCISGSAEALTMEYVGYYGAPDASFPRVGDVYYGHIMVGTVGNSCAGGADVHTQIVLPQDTYFVNNNGNVAVQCYYTPSGGSQPSNVTSDPDASCIQPYCVNGLCDLGTRVVATGGIFEVQFPIFSTKTLNGMSGGYATQLLASVEVTLAADSVTAPYQWVTVADNPPAISYPNPSYTNPDETTVRTTGYINAHYTQGDVYFDFGTDVSYGETVSAGRIDGTFDSYTYWNDWSYLTQNMTYHWRLRFVPDNGPIVYGADQAFTYAGSTTATQYSLAVTSIPAEGGSVSASPPGPLYDANASVSLTATPNEGFQFNGWTMDGAAAGNSNPLTVTMTKNRIVGVNWAPVDSIKYILTFTSSPASGGSISVSPSGPYDAGTPVTITATPASGYQLTGWTVDGVAKGSANPLSVTVNGNSEVIANFDLILSQDTSAFKGDANVPMLLFSIDAVDAQPMFLESITVSSSGSGNDALDVTAVKIYEDMNGNGISDDGDMLLGTGVYPDDNGTLDIAFDVASEIRPGTGTHKYLVTYNFNTTLASSLLFAPVSIAFIGVITLRRSRNRILAGLLAVMLLLLLLSCGGGGGASLPDDAQNSSGTRTYQVSLVGSSMEAQPLEPGPAPTYNVVTHVVSVNK